MKKEKILSKINPLVFKGVAHRGLWNKDISENSLNAFQRAIENNFAIEFDVHLTKDNELVVIHDEDLKRLTGKDGVVEHLTLKELKDNYSLLDGQKIPSLVEVLDLVHEQVPCLVELKVYEKNQKPLTKRFLEVIMPRIKDKKNFVFISFNPFALWPLKKTGIIRLLLVAKAYEYVYNLTGKTVEGVDIEQVLLEEKRFKKYSRKHIVNVWTIQSKEQLENVRPYVDTVTFDTIDPKLIKESFK